MTKDHVLVQVTANFLRRSRSHLLIKQPLKTLMQCIKRMPCNGDLFTSQSPFFPIFIMGVVSVTEEERSVARVWFETVVGGLDCRSVSLLTLISLLSRLINV